MAMHELHDTPETCVSCAALLCHLKIVTVKLEKVEGRAVCVVELVLYGAKITRLELFKKEIMRIA